MRVALCLRVGRSRFYMVDSSRCIVCTCYGREAITYYLRRGYIIIIIIAQDKIKKIIVVDSCCGVIHSKY